MVLVDLLQTARMHNNELLRTLTVTKAPGTGFHICTAGYAEVNKL